MEVQLLNPISVRKYKLSHFKHTPTLHPCTLFPIFSYLKVVVTSTQPKSHTKHPKKKYSIFTRLMFIDVKIITNKN